MTANRVLAHTGAKYPIVQAPMGWIARYPLASAVSRAGGLGIIETSSGETENCKAEIRKMAGQRPAVRREPADPVPARRRHAALRLRERREVRHHLGRQPGQVHRAAEGRRDHVYHAVPTVDAAVKCVEAGIDGLVVEGAEGGGFKNPEEVSTLVLLQAIRAGSTCR
jgi:enoyl-[acyl-carrier protein] reductase II